MSHYLLQVVAFCSDSENKMVSARNKLKDRIDQRREVTEQGTSEGRNLIVYGCAAHYINLVEKEVSPRTVLSHIVEVQKYFRNHHQPQGWLREKGGLKPQIPNDTRWNSQNACVDTFLENFPKYHEICIDNSDEIPLNIFGILNNAGLHMEAMNLSKQLKLVSSTLDRFQKDDCTLGEAVHAWYKLLEAPVLQAYNDVLKKRFKQCVTPAHLVAYQGNPKYKGLKLTSEEENSATEWLMNINDDFITPLLSLSISCETSYPKYMLSSKVIEGFTPANWWKAVKRKSEKSTGMVSPEFCSFMQELSSLPASSASVERIFSTFGFVHSKLRNRLGNAKTEKLVRCNRMLKGKAEDW